MEPRSRGGSHGVSNPSITLATLLLAANPLAFTSSGLYEHRDRLQHPLRRTLVDPRMQIFNENSLAAKMFGSIADGVKGIADAAGVDMRSEEEKAAEEAKVKDRTQKMATYKTQDAVSDIDMRAQSGDITFRDFIALSKAYSGLGDQQLPGMPKLTATQKREAQVEFDKGAKIVDVMLEEELDDPDIIIQDFRDGSGGVIGPRIQRLAEGSGVSAADVGMFVMKFEAMRESTQRIAAGENPDDIETSIAPQGGNRGARREMKKRQKKAAKQKSKR